VTSFAMAVRQPSQGSLPNAVALVDRACTPAAPGPVCRCHLQGQPEGDREHGSCSDRVRALHLHSCGQARRRAVLLEPCERHPNCSVPELLQRQVQEVSLPLVRPPAACTHTSGTRTGHARLSTLSRPACPLLPCLRPLMRLPRLRAGASAVPAHSAPRGVRPSNRPPQTTRRHHRLRRRRCHPLRMVQGATPPSCWAALAPTRPSMRAAPGRTTRQSRA
jgi:hypothetical protein